MTEIEFNPNGTVNVASTEHIKRIKLRCKEDETVHQRLAYARTYGKVKIGEIAAFNGREWLRVRATRHKGAAWIEVLKK